MRGISVLGGIKKPPLGIKPRYIHDEHRLAEIDAGIIRFMEAKQGIPAIWMAERDQLLEAIDARK